MTLIECRTQIPPRLANFWLDSRRPRWRYIKADKKRNFAAKGAFIRSAMNTEEQDDLWELLGRSKPAAPSPFFSRNVLRAIREEAQEKPGFWLWLRLHWRTVAVSACTVALASSLALKQ